MGEGNPVRPTRPAPVRPAPAPVQPDPFWRPLRQLPCQTDVQHERTCVENGCRLPREDESTQELWPSAELLCGCYPDGINEPCSGSHDIRGRPRFTADKYFTPDEGPHREPGVPTYHQLGRKKRNEQAREDDEW